MKSILVIGMGNFGRYLTSKLLDLNNDVMIIDQDEKKVEMMASVVTNAHIGDCTDINVLNSLGIDGFDVCFVAVDDNFQSSLEITSLLSELGAKYVVAKASRDIQAKFLLKNGANEVIYPEKDIAERLAIKFSSRNLFDYIPLVDNYSIFEIPIMEKWIDNSIRTLDLRKKYDINILAIKNGGTISPSPTPDYIFRKGDHILVFGKQAEIIKVANKIS